MGGAGGEGWRGRGWVVEKAPCSSHDPPSRPRVRPCPPLLSPTPPARRCCRSSLAGSQPAGEGAQEAQKAAFGPKNRFLRPKTLFGPKMHFGAKKRKMEPKRGKMEKGSPKHQRNHCLEQGSRKGAEMTPKRAQKRKNAYFCAQNRFLAQKSLLEEKVRK